MISDFRNRLRKQSGKPAIELAGDSLPDPTEQLMAWEHAIPDVLYETRSQVTPLDAQWRAKIYQHLLKVMALSLLDSLEQAEATNQIRDICQRLLDEHSAPVDSPNRPLVINPNTDAEPALGPLDPCMAD